MRKVRSILVWSALAWGVLVAPGTARGQEEGLFEGVPVGGEEAPDGFFREVAPGLSQDLDRLLSEVLAMEVPVEIPPGPPVRERAAVGRVERERDALGVYRETGEAPVVVLPSGRSFPFGEGVPSLVCVPTRACDVELEAGEVIDGLVVGDAARWETAFLSEGSGEVTPHILVKPKDFDLRTNLVVATSRRTYHLELVSPGEEEVEEGRGYHHHLAWWYPEDWLRQVRSEEERRAAEAAPVPSPVGEGLDPGALHFGYRVKGPKAKAKRLPWEPVTVFDDGRRTFVKLPPEAGKTALPVVLGRLASGETFPLNAELRGEWYVLPVVVAEAELVVGTGKGRRWLRLQNLAHPEVR